MILAALAAVSTANAVESNVLRLTHVVRPTIGRVAREYPTVAKLDAFRYHVVIAAATELEISVGTHSFRWVVIRCREWKEG